MISARPEAVLEPTEAQLRARAASYRQDRYLRHVHDTRLDQRLADLLANLWTTAADGQAAPIAAPQRRRFVLPRLVDVLEEQRLRAGLPAALAFDDGTLRARAVGGYAPPPLAGSLLQAGPDAPVRFSKRRFLEDSCERGGSASTPPPPTRTVT